MIPLSYFKAIQGAVGANSYQDVIRNETKDRILNDDYVTSINYCADATKNGKPQPVIAVPTDANYKYRVLARPFDTIATGDIFTFHNRHWIIVQVNSVVVTGQEGIAWECNHLFRFQDFAGNIYERWGVLDSGVYSTTTKATDDVSVLNKQYKIYLPLDPWTNTIYVDKRFATSTSYNAAGEEILTVYRITGIDPTSVSYGNDGHLLMMFARSDLYNESVDNVEQMLCDYIEPQPVETVEESNIPLCTIEGKQIVRIGMGTRTYVAKFLNKDGTEDTDSVPIWFVEIPEEAESYIEHDIGEDGVLSISANKGTPVGTIIHIHVDNGLLENTKSADKNLEVTTIG